MLGVTTGLPSPKPLLPIVHEVFIIVINFENIVLLRSTLNIKVIF